ncbi:hypothetical protein D3C80_1622460 [compost metagenome]
MGAEQHADEQIGEDHRLAQASEDGHQQNGGEQQDQHIGVHTSLPLICPHGPKTLRLRPLALSDPRRCGAGYRPCRGRAASGARGCLPSHFMLLSLASPFVFHRTYFGHGDCKKPVNEWRGVRLQRGKHIVFERLRTWHRAVGTADGAAHAADRAGYLSAASGAAEATGS